MPIIWTHQLPKTQNKTLQQLCNAVEPTKEALKVGPLGCKSWKLFCRLLNVQFGVFGAAITSENC
ncbi:uncharacterized protein MTB314_1626 [Streptococcus pyogenes]|nr:uncharacterized protein MTB314_1626 [Streptococcus pyogenes]BBJ30732.1 hypothetical protein A85_15550 [Streptococcus pyogenes]